MRLAQITGLPALALDPSCGIEQPRRVAWIDPQWCIGCTLCIQACPVDAIVGAAKAMHAVIPALCTGCDLCVAPCPVDCIHMQPLTQDPGWHEQDVRAAQQRYEARAARLAPFDMQRRELNKRQLVESALRQARARLAAIKQRAPDNTP